MPSAQENNQESLQGHSQPSEGGRESVYSRSRGRIMVEGHTAHEAHRQSRERAMRAQAEGRIYEQAQAYLYPEIQQRSTQPAPDESHNSSEAYLEGMRQQSNRDKDGVSSKQANANKRRRAKSQRSEAQSRQSNHRSVFSDQEQRSKSANGSSRKSRQLQSSQPSQQSQQQLQQLQQLQESLQPQQSQWAQQMQGSSQPQQAQQPQQSAKRRSSDGARNVQGAHGNRGSQSVTAKSVSGVNGTSSANGVNGANGAHGAVAPTRGTKTKQKSRYVPALDGLRCLAVLVVIAYHMHFDWAPGGLLGVTMFFVLSGYLITGLLLKEYNETRTISLKNFWLRRVRRIIPAIVFAVLGTAILCGIFDQALLTKMRPDVLPTLFFFNNWWQIFHNVSYFDALGEPSPLTHCWSLSIEEQFYLIWPVALLLLMRAGVKKKTIRNGTLVLAALSAIEMALLFSPDVDPSRVYYGTDTRAFSLLIGAFLSFVWPYQKLTERAGEAMSQGGRLAFNLVGVGAVVGLLLMVVFTNGFAPFIYQGGLVICSVLTALAIAVMVHPISWIGKVFAFKPFVFIGKISYSMYLWHYPIILLMTPNNMVGALPIWLCLLQFIVIFAVSAFSYYVVENPIRHGAIGKVIANVRDGLYTFGQYFREHIIPTILVVVFFVVSIGMLLFTPNTSAVDTPNALQTEITQRMSQAVEKQKLFVEAEKEARKLDLLLIGDSVPESMYGYGTFAEVFPTGYIDATRGRQLYMAPEVYKGYKDAGMVGDVVVFALGTNGYVTDEQIDTLMAEVGGDQQVWFVNTRSPEAYMEESNAAIQRAVDRYGNAHLIDWFTLSEDHPEYFDGDGTHLTPDASRTYAQMIFDAVKDYLPEEAKNGEGASDKGGAAEGTHNEMDPYLQ